MLSKIIRKTAAVAALTLFLPVMAISSIPQAPVGLVNRDFTCFLNAALQCLWNQTGFLQTCTQLQADPDSVSQQLAQLTQQAIDPSNQGQAIDPSCQGKVIYPETLIHQVREKLRLNLPNYV